MRYATHNAIGSVAHAHAGSLPANNRRRHLCARVCDLLNFVLNYVRPSAAPRLIHTRQHTHTHTHVQPAHGAHAGVHHVLCRSERGGKDQSITCRGAYATHPPIIINRYARMNVHVRECAPVCPCGREFRARLCVRKSQRVAKRRRRRRFSHTAELNERDRLKTRVTNERAHSCSTGRAYLLFGNWHCLIKTFSADRQTNYAARVLFFRPRVAAVPNALRRGIRTSNY